MASNTELELAAVALVSTSVSTTLEKMAQELESNKPSTENSSNECDKIKILKAALEKELPLVDAGDPTATERCHLVLQSLLQLAFTVPIQLSQVRPALKKFRNYPTLSKLANRVLRYAFLDRESRQWRQALDNNDPDKVKVKVAVFCLYVEKHRCLSVEVMDWLNLRLLVGDTAGLFYNNGHQDCGHFERLKCLMAEEDGDNLE